MSSTSTIRHFETAPYRTPVASASAVSPVDRMETPGLPAPHWFPARSHLRPTDVGSRSRRVARDAAGGRFRPSRSRRIERAAPAQPRRRGRRGARSRARGGSRPADCRRALDRRPDRVPLCRRIPGGGRCQHRCSRASGAVRRQVPLVGPAASRRRVRRTGRGSAPVADATRTRGAPSAAPAGDAPHSDRPRLPVRPPRPPARRRSCAGGTRE